MMVMTLLMAFGVVAAIEFYRQAAERDCAEALYNLGRCYHHGEVSARPSSMRSHHAYRYHQGVAKNMGTAAEWYAKAAALVRSSSS